MEPDRDGNLFEFLMNRLQTANTCLLGHEFPEGMTAKALGRFAWVGEPEGSYCCELELHSSLQGVKAVPARMFVEFVPDTDIVAVAACMLVDPNTGGIYGQAIGMSPYMNPLGRFLTTIDGKQVETSWDIALQKVHYCAAQHVDSSNADEVEALKALHFAGSHYGEGIDWEVPGLPRIDPTVTAESMLAIAERRTAFGEKLAMCLKIAAREKATVNPQIGSAIEVVANLWDRFGGTLERAFNLVPQVVRVDFVRGRVLEDHEELKALPQLG